MDKKLQEFENLFFSLPTRCPINNGGWSKIIFEHVGLINTQ